MPNCSLYKNGVTKAMEAGVYKPENVASCRIKAIQGSTKSSGLGKGGRRTRRARSSKRRSTRRNRY